MLPILKTIYSNESYYAVNEKVEKWKLLIFTQNNSSFRWEERAPFCPFNILGSNTRCYTGRPAHHYNAQPELNVSLGEIHTVFFCILPSEYYNKETGGSKS